jgi:hypothetical protein
MSMHEEPRTFLPPDPTIQEELTALGDEALFEMTNLPPDRTGIRGILFLSTSVGFHGPRVKYFVKTGKGEPSFSVSIATEPKVLASSLPERVVREMAPQVIAWVALNRDELLAFWNDGETWMCDEVQAFIGRLKKVEG